MSMKVPHKQLRYLAQLESRLLVLYVMTGCRFCPPMQELVEQLGQKEGIKVALVQFNPNGKNENDADILAAEVRAFPTLHIYEKTQKREYDRTAHGPVSAENILKWITKN